MTVESTPACFNALDQAELECWGRSIGAEVVGSIVIALHGPLGAGKSVFARAIARGAGVEGDVPSPSFTLLNRYRGREGREVVHMDLYRLRDPAELLELGWEEIGADGEITLIEWPERAGSKIPEVRWDFTITPCSKSTDHRDVVVERVSCPTPIPVPLRSS